MMLYDCMMLHDCMILYLHVYHIYIYMIHVYDWSIVVYTLVHRLNTTSEVIHEDLMLNDVQSWIFNHLWGPVLTKER